MRFLIFGGKGWIGRSLIKLLQDQGDEVVISQVRADDDSAVATELDNVKPDRVIVSLGRTHGGEDENGGPCSTIDWLEVKGRLQYNVRDNLYAPVLISLLCKERDIHVSSVATGCIFTTDDPLNVGDQKFTETDIGNFFGSSYSTVKSFTDRLLRYTPTLVCRIRMPLTGDRSTRNFITKITTYKKVVNIQNSMTVLHTLLPVLIDLSKKKHMGIVNLTNPDTISHNEVLELYKEIVDPSFTWENFTVDEQAKILLAGRSNCALDTTFIEQNYPEVPHIKDAVRECMEAMKGN